MPQAKVDLVRRVWLEFRKLDESERKLPIFLAISGGRDSTVLADVLLRLRERLPPLRWLHVNYRLRVPDSDREEEGLRAWAAREQVSFSSQRLDPETKPANLQAWARERRYRFFSEVVRRQGGGVLWLAHHQDDQAETVLQRLLRGASFKGLGGMKRFELLAGCEGEAFPAPLPLFRPLLQVPALALEAYRERRGLEFFEDRSNAQEDYLRNRLRHRYLPALRQENPQLAASLGRFAVQAQELQSYLQTQALDWIQAWVRPGEKGDFQVPVPELQPLPQLLKVKIFEILILQRLPQYPNLGAVLEAVRAALFRRKILPQVIPLKDAWALHFYPDRIALEPRSSL